MTSTCASDTDMVFYVLRDSFRLPISANGLGESLSPYWASQLLPLWRESVHSCPQLQVALYPRLEDLMFCPGTSELHSRQVPISFANSSALTNARFVSAVAELESMAISISFLEAEPARISMLLP